MVTPTLSSAPASNGTEDQLIRMYLSSALMARGVTPDHRWAVDTLASVAAHFEGLLDPAAFQAWHTSLFGNQTTPTQPASEAKPEVIRKTIEVSPEQQRLLDEKPTMKAIVPAITEPCTSGKHTKAIMDQARAAFSSVQINIERTPVKDRHQVLPLPQRFEQIVRQHGVKLAQAGV